MNLRHDGEYRGYGRRLSDKRGSKKSRLIWRVDRDEDSSVNDWQTIKYQASCSIRRISAVKCQGEPQGLRDAANRIDRIT